MVVSPASFLVGLLLVLIPPVAASAPHPGEPTTDVIAAEPTGDPHPSHPEDSDACAGSLVPDLPGASMLATSEQAHAAGVACDDGTVIDVLVAYTPAARLAAGGVAGIEAEIDLSISVANDVFTNSAIPLQLALVHAVEVAYDENGTYPEHLDRLRLTNDGIMDEVHALRDEHGADLVNLFLAAGGSCGFAYRMVNLSPLFESFAFSVVRWSCAASSRSFVHEIGHNMGCCHDQTEGCVNPIYDQAFGHRFFGDHAKQYRTVMANAPGVRIPNFSNPNVLHDGQPTGIPAGQPNPADCAATITTNALTVANFRCRAVACPEDLDDSGEVGFSDILQIIGAWGPCPACPEDLDGSGDVGFGDILAAIGAWGPC